MCSRGVSAIRLWSNNAGSFDAYVRFYGYGLTVTFKKKLHKSDN